MLNLANASILVKLVKLFSKNRCREELYLDPELDSVMTKYPRWAENVFEAQPVNHVVQIDLRNWQNEIIGLLSKPPVHRRIIWIWSAASKTGKSTFQEYCSTKWRLLPAKEMFYDIIYGYDEEIIWFDYTRAQAGYEVMPKIEGKKFIIKSFYSILII